MLKIIETSDGPRGRSGGNVSRVALWAIAAMAVVGAGVGVMNAQSGTAGSGAGEAAPAYSSSMAGETEASVVAPLPDLGKMMMGAGGGHGQYYGGQPRYYGYRNGDDSARFTVYFGGGATVPLANTSDYLTQNFSIQGGMGPRLGQVPAGACGVRLGSIRVYQVHAG